MANDPPAVPPQNQAEMLDNITSAQTRYNTSMGGYNKLIEETGGLLNQFEAKLAGTGITLDNLGKVAAEQTEVFTGLWSAAIKAQNAFDGFNGIDTKGIMTFTGQFNDLRQMLASGALAGDQAKNVLETLKQQFLGMGGSPKLLAEAVSKGASAVLDLTQNMFANADRAIATQDAILQMAGATGMLDQVTEKAGDQLQNMNNILDMYNEVTNAAKGETNSTVSQINEYSAALLRIPGAMNSVITSATSEGKSMSSLSAMVKLSHGTHRDFSKVVDDVKHSVVNYGTSLQDSMKFTSQITELSGKLNVQFDDMKSGLFSVTDAFGKMTNAGDAAAKMQSGITQMMADYVSRLEATGMPAKQATELVAGLGQQFGQLSIAQKAFLSAQTGGPGGLMGGFQIEKMVREGDFAGLRKKMTDLFQKQFGNNIVTLEDASKSQGSAAQFQRQTALLRQGPMGQMFKTDDDAHRFMEAMKAEKEGKPLPGGKDAKLDPMGLQKTIEKGSTWEAKTNTAVNNIATDAARIRGLLEQNSLAGVQKAMTGAYLPSGETRNADQQAMANELKSFQIKSGLRGAQQSSILQDEFSKGGDMRGDLRKTHTEAAVNDFVIDLKKLPTVLKSVFSTMQSSLSMGDFKKAGMEEKALVNDIQERRSAADKKGVSKDRRKELLESAQMEEDKLQEYKQWREKNFGGARPTPTNITPLPRGATGRTDLGPLPRTGVHTPGANVGAAQRGTTAPAGRAAHSAPGDVPTNVQIQKNGADGTIAVDVVVNVKNTGGQSQSNVPQGGT